MPITLSLVPTRPSFCPGDVLTATLEVKNVGDDASAGPLELAGVNVDFRGTERIDRSWIGASYAPTRGPVRRDGKREVRTIVETPPARLVMQDTTLLLGESRVWLVRFCLPRTLPPSFKGVSVRYSYTLQATAQYARPKPFTPASSVPLSSSASVADPSGVESFSAQAGDAGGNSSAGGPSGWGNSAFAASMAQVESAVEAAEMKAPSRWRTAEAIAAVHLWSPMEAYGPRGTSGSVAAGEEATLTSVAYQLGYTVKDAGVDFQVLTAQEVGEAARARAGKAGSFAFLQPGQEQLWQPAFLTSIDHQPSLNAPTPTLAAAPVGQQQRPPQEKSLASLEEDTATPFSELSLNPGGDPDGQELPQTASSARSARSAMASGRQHSLTSPHAAADAVLRSYNLRLGDSALVRIALHAPLDGPLVLGAVLAGTFDFRASQAASKGPSAAPKCIQVAVLLETEEAVSESYQSAKSARLQSAAIRKVWDEHVEVTSDLTLTHFMFSLPLDAPASFATHLVALRWVLRFEFTTSAAKPAGWLSSASTPEQIVWSLPVLVRPPVAVA